MSLLTLRIIVQASKICNIFYEILFFCKKTKQFSSKHFHLLRSFRLHECFIKFHKKKNSLKKWVYNSEKNYNFVRVKFRLGKIMISYNYTNTDYVYDNYFTSHHTRIDKMISIDLSQIAVPIRWPVCFMSVNFMHIFFL